MSLSKLLSDSAKKRKQTVPSVRWKIQQQLFDPTRFNNLKTISPSYTQSQIPRLWVPPITHYKPSSSASSDSSSPDIDTERQALHFDALSECLGGYLINGSTSDGWTLSVSQQQTVLTSALDFMHSNKPRYFKPVIIGAMAHEYNGKILSIRKYIQMLTAYYNVSEDDDANQTADDIYTQSPFAGFVLTPPSNTSNQKEIEECLSDIIDAYKQYPFVLYQLPQITNSEMSPETVSNLTARFGNIIMLKDSSGTDAIVKSGQCSNGVFMVRGAEGNPAQHLLDTNFGMARYHGLLLSTANNYASHLNRLVMDVMDGNYGKAQQISDVITNVSQETFDVVQGYQFANPFTNSAKMVDFCMAFGHKATQIMESHEMHHLLPITGEGRQYDVNDLAVIRDILIKHGILQSDSVGYMEPQRKQWWKKQ